MSSPIKLLDAYQWFQGQPHQVDAAQWLDAQLTDAQREEFGRRFRSQSSAILAPDLVQLELSWLGGYHTSGFRIFRLALTKNGNVIDKIPVISGDLSTQKESFVRPERDHSSSLRCLPEGIYSIGRIENSPLMRATSLETEVGQYWIGLEALPPYKVTNRSTFGIHVDAAYRPGSAGSICPFKDSDMEKILQWMEAKNRPTQLVCDLGTGFLKETSFQSELPREKEAIAAKFNGRDVLETALQFTLRWEGGKVDHPADIGGRTNRGITQRTYDQFRKLKGLPKQDVFIATLQETREIYQNLYWKPSKADVMIPPLAVVHFDTAVLFGVGGAIQFLQEALDIKVDGDFGTETQSAFKTANNKKTALKIIDGRITYHRQRVRQSLSQQVFLKGWLNRAEDLRKFISSL